jgi:hypothetical protein
MLRRVLQPLHHPGRFSLEKDVEQSRLGTRKMKEHCKSGGREGVHRASTAFRLSRLQTSICHVAHWLQRASWPHQRQRETDKERERERKMTSGRLREPCLGHRDQIATFPSPSPSPPLSPPPSPQPPPSPSSPPPATQVLDNLRLLDDTLSWGVVCPWGPPSSDPILVPGVGPVPALFPLVQVQRPPFRGATAPCSFRNGHFVCPSPR